MDLQIRHHVLTPAQQSVFACLKMDIYYGITCKCKRT